jgi:hypothetical protein
MGTSRQLKVGLHAASSAAAASASRGQRAGEKDQGAGNSMGERLSAWLRRTGALCRAGARTASTIGQAELN